MKKLLFLLYFIPIITFGQTIQNVTPFFGADIPYHNPADSIYVSWTNKPDGVSALYTAQYLRNNFLQWFDSTRYVTPYYLTHANMSFKGTPNFTNGLTIEGGTISLGTNSISSLSGKRTWGANASAGMVFGDNIDDHYVVINTSPTTGYVGVQNGANTTSIYLQQTGVQFKTGNYNYALNLNANTLTANHVISIPDSSGTIALTSNLNSYLNKANNLSDLLNPSIARSNIGLPYGTLTNLNNQIVIRAFGPSITEGGQGGSISWPAQLSTLSGYSVNNYGIGGQTSTQILTRLQADNATGNTNFATVIDNFSINSWQNISTEEANYSAALTSLASNTRYLFTSIIRGSSALVQNGTTGASNIAILNAYAASIAPGHYVDLMPPLLAAAAHTHQDSLDVAAGIVPTSLRVDSVHLTTAGYAIIANTIYNAISMLQDGITVVTNTEMAGLFANKPLIDATRGFTVNGRYIALIPNQTNFIGTEYIGSFNNSGTQPDPSYNLIHNAGNDGQYNFFGSYLSGVNATTAAFNSNIGAYGLNLITTGVSNSNIGYAGLSALTSGGYNVNIGFNGQQFATTSSYNTSIGANALKANTTGTNNLAGGYGALGGGTVVSQSVGLGYNVFSSESLSGTALTGVGYNVGKNTTTGYNLTYIGWSAGASNTTGYNNTGGGYNFLFNNSSGHGNTGWGVNALFNNTTGSYNIGEGQNAGQGNQTGSSNIFIAYNSGPQTTGTNINNTIDIGGGSGLGAQSGETNGINIGMNAGSSVTTGNYNLHIGDQSNSGITTGNYNTVLVGGTFGGYSSATSNGLFLGDQQSHVLIYVNKSNLGIAGQFLRTASTGPFVASSIQLSDLPSGTQLVSNMQTGTLSSSNTQYPSAQTVANAIGTTVRGYGQVTLSSGQATVSISGVSTSSRAHISFVSIGGTVSTTWQYAGVCTSGTLTITALTNTGGTNTSDTSVLTYYVEN
jgi:lysophospholipase L1-like esterase